MTGLKIRFRAGGGTTALDAAGAQLGWIWGIYVGEKTTTGPMVEDTATETWYLMVVRRSGQRQIYYLPSGGSVSAILTGTVPGTVYSNLPTDKPAEYEYEVEITATQIIIRNLSLGTSDTVAHSGLRSDKAVISLAVKNASSYIKDVRVVR
jgi:hypothetical protein